MKDTNEFVQEIHDKQKKDLQNKKRQGDNQPSKKLPNKQH